MTVPVIIDQDVVRIRGQGYSTSKQGRVISRKSKDHPPPAMFAFDVKMESDLSITYWYLCDEIGEWLLAHGKTSKDCELFYDRKKGFSGNWIVYVPEDIAMMFKLTWGGV